MRNLILYGGARRKYQRGGRSLKKKDHEKRRIVGIKLFFILLPVSLI